MKNMSIRTGFVVAAFIVGAALVFPLATFAQSAPSIWPTGYWGPILTCHGTECNLCHMLQTFQNLAYVMLSIGIFAIAPIFFVWGGIRIITAGASPSGITAGKSILTGTVVGVLIGLGAFLIINTVLKALNDVNPGAGSKVGWPVISCAPGQVPGLQ